MAKIYDLQRYTVVSGDVITLPLNSNRVGDVAAEDLIVQTDADIPFTAEGSVDGSNFQSLKLLDVANYNLLSAATVEGVYSIAPSGYSIVKLTFTGAGTLSVKLLK